MNYFFWLLAFKDRSFSDGLKQGLLGAGLSSLAFPLLLKAKHGAPSRELYSPSSSCPLCIFFFSNQTTWGQSRGSWVSWWKEHWIWGPGKLSSVFRLPFTGGVMLGKSRDFSGLQFPRVWNGQNKHHVGWWWEFTEVIQSRCLPPRRHSLNGPGLDSSGQRWCSICLSIPTVCPRMGQKILKGRRQQCTLYLRHARRYFHCFIKIISLMLQLTLWGRKKCYPHFLINETGTERLGELTEATEVVSRGAGIWRLALWLQPEQEEEREHGQSGGSPCGIRGKAASGRAYLSDHFRRTGTREGEGHQEYGHSWPCQSTGNGQPEPTHERGRLGHLLRGLWAWRCPCFWRNKYLRTELLPKKDEGAALLVPMHVHHLPLLGRQN